MLLRIGTTRTPATDLGWLLHKHPAKVQVFELAFGQVHVFYPEATDDRCTAALVLDVDPVGLVRRRGGPSGDGFSLQQYVNDRPYVASSFMSVAIAQVYGSALGGRCVARPELVHEVLPLEVRIAVLPCRGGEAFLRRLFEPLGYAVTAEGHPLDPKFPDWGDSCYYTVTLRGDKRLRDLLTHLYVLIPVLDNDKHYWVGQDELEKLLRQGETWLAGHPEREVITTRYLKHQRRLAREALARLAEEDHPDPDAEETEHEHEEAVLEAQISMDAALLAAAESIPADHASAGAVSADTTLAETADTTGQPTATPPFTTQTATAAQEALAEGASADATLVDATDTTGQPTTMPVDHASANAASAKAASDRTLDQPASLLTDDEPLNEERGPTLNTQRLGLVLAALRGCGAKSVVDLGCGEGRLLRLLLNDKRFERIVGMDVSLRLLKIASERLRLDRLPPMQRRRIELMHGSLMYRDARLAGFDAATCVEVVEHLDPPRLAAFERVLFEFARPRTIVLTTPNREYNVKFETLPAGRLRHRDHRFEWTRSEFETWANGLAARFGYAVRFLPVGPSDRAVGAPTQMAVFCPCS